MVMEIWSCFTYIQYHRTYSTFENVVAQELIAHGFALYYYSNKKMGELDFLIEIHGEVVPIEVKSGKDYKAHSALNSVINTRNYNINEAIVLSNSNVKVENNIHYLPIYMIMFISDNDISFPKFDLKF